MYFSINTIDYNQIKDRLEINQSKMRTTAIVYLFKYNNTQYAYKEYKAAYKRNDVSQYLTDIIFTLTNNEFSSSLKAKMAMPEILVKNAGVVTGFMMHGIPEDCYYKTTNGKTKEFTLGKLISIIEDNNISRTTASDIDKKIIHFSKRLINDIAYLHSIGVVVGDGFSDDNILIRQVGERWYPYYIDVDSYGLAKSNNPIGTYNSVGFKPPEGDENTPPSVETDIWKMSVIIFRLFSKSPQVGEITKASDDPESLNRIKICFGVEACELIKKGLSEKANERPSVAKFDSVFNENETAQNPPWTNFEQSIEECVNELVNFVDYSLSKLHPEDGVYITSQGRKKIEKHFGIDNLYASKNKKIYDEILQMLNKKTKSNTVFEPANTFNGGFPTSSDANKPKQPQANTKKTDQNLLKKIKRVNTLLAFNLVTAILLVANLWLSKCQISLSYWNYIAVCLPIVSAIIYLFVTDITDEKKSTGWAKFDTVLSWLLGGSFIPVLGGLYALFVDVDNDTFALSFLRISEIVLVVFAIPFLAITTIQGIRYLKNNKFNDQHIAAISTSSIILCSALAILVFCVIWNLFAFNSLFSSLKVGSTVTLGSYEQDGDSSNGKEPISWTVESIDDGKALLLSDVCLYAMPYNSDSKDNSWTNSDLRKWLNNEFYQSAFSSEKQDVVCEGEIITKRLSNKVGHTYGETYGEAEVTLDKVFVPDLSEFEMLTNELNVSPVAKEIFLKNNPTYGKENYQSMFWTRSPYGEQQNYACGYITETEQRMSYSTTPTMYAMVRPAIIIDVELYSNLLKEDQKHYPSNVDVGLGAPYENQVKPHYYCYENGTYVYADSTRGFGPGVWADPNESVDFDSYIYKEFCNRLEHDPVMAAAVFASADRKLGTRYTGNFYSEIKNDWISGINNAAKNFIGNMYLWDNETTAFEKLLKSTSDISIKNANGEEIETLRIQSGDEQPIICGPERLKTSASSKYLCFTITVKGTQLTLLFLIDFGFQPVI